jgi:hypothetical protein
MQASIRVAFTGVIVMRLRIALAVFLMTTPAFAQDAGSSSGASAVVNMSDPPGSSTTRLVTAPTVIAPGLAAAGVETCLGSTSGGLSLMGGGFSFGSTVVDEGCTIRLLARQLFAFGFHKAAMALMCQDDRVAAAMDAVGSPCPSHLVQVSDSSGATDPAPRVARENGID